MDHIAINLTEIKQRIASAAERSGRKPDDITLIGVTKTIDNERINRLRELGVTDMGENRVQELMKKQETMDSSVSSGINWHLIGHLQTNKVKNIVHKVKTIQSVDSLELLKEIDKRYAPHDHTGNKPEEKIIGQNNSKAVILLEVNVANEQSKFGIKSECLSDFVLETIGYKNILLLGLMTVAPFVVNQEENRYYFRKMRQLMVDINRKYEDNVRMNHLSMGMSNDFETAIEEGATMVRIGTGLFGSRT